MADFSFDQIVSGTLGANVNATLAGLDKIHSTVDGGLTTTLAGHTDHSTASTVTIAPLATSSDVRVELAPVQATTDSRVDTTVDFKPVAVDSCVRVVLGELPPTDLHTPYEQTWSWSLLGQELFSLTVRGETTTRLSPGRHRPHVI